MFKYNFNINNNLKLQYTIFDVTKSKIITSKERFIRQNQNQI